MPLDFDATHPDYSESPQTNNGEVRIGKYMYSVVGGKVNALNLARFQGKTTFGDYSFDSDPLLSSQIFTSFTGGMGNQKVKPGVDDDTFWTATLETRYPDGPTLLPLSEAFGAEIGAGNAIPIADFPAATPSLYVAFDDELRKWNDATQAFDVAGLGVLPATPVERGVIFEGLLYIPLGGNGYATVTSGDVITAEAGIDAVQFILWDRKLVALDTDGGLWIKPRGLAWQAPTDDLTIPDGVKPRKLAIFIDQRGSPTVYIVSDTMLYTYDPDQEVLHDTHLDYPKHPNQGLGVANWRGESLYVSFGTGIRSYNGSITASMGPDRRHGLPAHLRGTIVDLYPEYNALLAMVQGEGVVGEEVEDTFRIHPPMFRDANMAIGSYQSAPVYSSILRYSNSQWHKVWESPVPSGFPSLMYVSEADGNYRLWWGYGGAMYVQDLPISDQNPKQGLKSGSQRFMPEGELVTGWFDADMVAFRKLASHVELNLEDVTEAYEAGGTVRIYYQTERDPGWVLLGEGDLPGRTILLFGNIDREVGDDFSTGLSFRRIRFRWMFFQREGNERLSPLVSSLIFKFMKIPESQLSWSFTVDLSDDAGFKGVGNDVLAAYLDSLLTDDTLFEFGLGDETYRTRMAQAQGDQMTGYDDRGGFQVNLVEVKAPENEHLQVIS